VDEICSNNVLTFIQEQRWLSG